MRLVIQRVKGASVTIGGKVVSSIGQGLFILVGVENGDTEEDAKWLASKTSGMRIFNDDEGVMNRSIPVHAHGIHMERRVRCRYAVRPHQ